MGKTYQDTIRLDFEINSKGASQLQDVVRNLEKLEKVLQRLQGLGVMMGKEFEPLSKANEEIKRATSLWEKFKQQLRESAQEGKKFTVFGEDIGKLTGKITLFVLLTGAIVKTLGYIFDLIKVVGQLESEMARVASASRVSGQTLASAMFDIRKEALLVARDFNTSFTEVAKAAYAAGSAGLTVGQQIASLRPVTNLVVGTLSNMEETAKLVAGAFNVFGDKLGSAGTDVEKFQAITDILADTFARQQVELEELGAGFSQAASAVSILDVQFDEMVTVLGFLNTGMLKGSRAGTALLNSMIQLAKESDKLKEKFNVAFDPTRPLKFTDIILQVAEQIRSGGISAEEFKDLVDVFNIRGARAVAQIASDMTRFEEAISHSVENTKHMAAVLAKVQSDTLAGSFQRMTNSLGEMLVYLNDIVPATRILALLFSGIGHAAGVINNTLSTVAKVTNSVFANMKIGVENAELAQLKSQLSYVSQLIDQISSKKTFASSEYLKSLQTSRESIKQQIAEQEAYIRFLDARKEAPPPGSDASIITEIDPNLLPKSVRLAVLEMKNFVKEADIARGINGDILSKVFDVNVLLAKVNQRVQTNSRVSVDVAAAFGQQKLELSSALTFDEKRLKTLIAIVTQTTKSAEQEKEAQEILKGIAEVTKLVGDRRKEITDATEKGLRSERERVVLETLSIRNTKEEVVTKTKTAQALDELNAKLKTNISLSQIQGLNAVKILALAGQNKEALEIAKELLKDINDETLAGTRTNQRASDRANEKMLEGIRAQGKVKEDIMQAMGGNETQIAQARLASVNAEIEELKRKKKLKDDDQINTEAMAKQIDDLTQKQVEYNLQITTLIPLEERRKERMKSYQFLQSIAITQGNTEIEQAAIKVKLFEQLLTLAETDRDAQFFINDLKRQGIDLLSVQRDLMLAQAQEAHNLSKAINDGIKDSLFESLTQAKALDEALNSVGDTIGKIILRKQFENVMNQILNAFDVGGITVESQLQNGGTLFITKLQTELPPLFSQMGEIFASTAKSGLGVTDTGGSASLSLTNISASGKSVIPNTAISPQDDTLKGFGRFFSGALTGAALANARGRDQTSQIAAAVGGAVGNAVLPGIGGIIGGFLGSLLGGNKDESTPKEDPVPFKLDTSNTTLKDINRNLVGLRQDTQAFALQSSFYFSASARTPLCSSISVGDIVINGAVTAQDAGHIAVTVEQQLTNILQEQMSRGSR